MDLQITSLASGSSGNVFLVQTTTQTLLVEAGQAARTIERQLQRRGIDPASLGAIVVSHEHHDHMQAAGPLARRYAVPIVCSPGTAAVMQRDWHGLDVRTFGADGLTVGDVDLWGFPLPHDAQDPQGLLLEHAGHTVGWALDLGHVPDHLVACLQEADLVIVESNHDRERLMQAPYGWSVKHRILSDRGHLSNLQAAALLAGIGADGRRRTAWLAHLSERANDHPRSVRKIVEAYLLMAGVDSFHLDIAERDRPSAAWTSQATLLQGALF